MREEHFDLAADEFLRLRPWADESHRQVVPDAWQFLDECFEDFLADALARKRDADVRRQKEIVMRRQKRWEEYLATADVPDWPDMTDDDRALIAKARSLQGELERDLTDDEFMQGTAVGAKERNYIYRQLQRRRNEIVDLKSRVELLVRKADHLDAEQRAEILEHMDDCYKFIGRASTMKALDAIASRLERIEGESTLGGGTVEDLFANN